MWNSPRKHRLREHSAGVLRQAFIQLERILLGGRVRESLATPLAKHHGIRQRLAVPTQRCRQRAPLELHQISPVQRVEMRVGNFVRDEAELRLNAMEGFVSEQHATLIRIGRQRQQHHRPAIAVPVDRRIRDRHRSRPRAFADLVIAPRDEMTRLRLDENRRSAKRHAPHAPVVARAHGIELVKCGNDSRDGDGCQHDR